MTKISDAYETSYVISFSNLTAILIFFWYKGLYVFDVPRQARKMLLLRAILHSLALIVFVKTLEFFNPLVAVVNFHIGLYTATVIGRLFHRTGKERWISLVPCIKYFVTAIIFL